MSERELLCTIWLTFVFGYGSKRPAELIEKFGSAYNVFQNGIEELHFGRLSESVKLAFAQKDLTYAEYILEKCNRDKMQIVCIQDEIYPKLLREISNPPVVLYCKGNIDRLSEMLFTAVGTRMADDEGKRIINDFLPPIKNAGFTIVSGFADGAEEYIHKNIGETIAVLPNGINVNYPATNAGLKEIIIEKGGLVVTEFVHDVRPYKGNFYLRNRLLAGLSYGVLVLQAVENSGTSISATAAGDYGRQVYAVPGSLYNPRFKGSIEMIRTGAIAVNSPYQILEDYSAVYEDIKMPLSYKEEPNTQIADLTKEKYKNLDETELKVISCISGNRVHADEISARTGISVQEINSALMSLEIEGLVVRLDGNQYIIH